MFGFPVFVWFDQKDISVNILDLVSNIHTLEVAGQVVCVHVEIVFREDVLMIACIDREEILTFFCRGSVCDDHLVACYVR